MPKLNILFSGGLASCRNFESGVLDKKEAVLGSTLSFIEMADLYFTNLGCSLATHNKAINKSRQALKANLDCIEVLKPIPVIGLANNNIII